MSVTLHHYFYANIILILKYTVCLLDEQRIINGDHVIITIKSYY